MIAEDLGYTEDEWFLITTLPAQIGAVVAAIDKSGFFGTIREMNASMHAAQLALTEHQDNPLIYNSLKPEGATSKEAYEDAHHRRIRLMNRAREKGIDTPEKHAEQVLADCRDVNRILEDKAIPAHAEEYKEWACSIGHQVAEAAKEGGFFERKDADPVSPKEAELLAKIHHALGVETA